MFTPIGDENPTQRIPYANYGLIAFNCLIYLLINFRSDFEAIVVSYGFTPDRAEFITIFTSMFMHAGFFHLLGNMIYLWVFGDNVEDILGYFYVPFYVLSGVAADILHYMMYPGSGVPAVGASGAISGVLGFYLIFFPWHRVKFWYWIWFYTGTFFLEAVWAIGFWFLLQIAYGWLFLYLPDLGGVAYWAHIGGFIFGAVIGITWKLTRNTAVDKAIGVKVNPKPRPIANFPRENPNQVLAGLMPPGSEIEFIQNFIRLARFYGEARIEPQYHLKAADIFSDRKAYREAAAVYTTFLLLYPGHPLIPNIKYYLGLLLIYHLNQPKRGMKYLQQLLSGNIADEALLDEVRKELALANSKFPPASA